MCRDMEKDDIMQILKEAYVEVFHKDPPDPDRNLLSLSLNNETIFYLYWFDKVEKKTCSSIIRHLGEVDSTVMTLNRICELIERISSEIDRRL